MDERIRELEKCWFDERNKMMCGMIRISALADKWDMERDDLREDNKQLAAERDDLVELITQLHRAKGRYHTQIAMCDLFDAVELKNERPAK